MAGDKNKDEIWPVPSASFTSVNNYLLAKAGSSLPLLAQNELSAFLPWLPTEQPAAMFVWFIPSSEIFQTKAVYMVPGSS